MNATFATRTNLQTMARRLRRRVLPTRFDKILAIPGWTFEPALRFLMASIQALPDHSSVVEIGVWQGRSALAMAEACRGTDKKVFAIDPWQEYKQAGVDVSSRLKEWDVNSFADVYDAFRSNCRKFDLERWVMPIRSPSVDAAKNWSHGPVAMVFIDGNHDYDAVTADLSAWVPLLQRGRLVCGDDWNWETVRTAVTDFVSHRTGCHLECLISL